MNLSKICLNSLILVALSLLSLGAVAGQSLGTYCFVDDTGNNFWTVSVESVGGGNFAVWGHIDHNAASAMVDVTTFSGAATMQDSTTVVASLSQGLLAGSTAFHTLTVDLTTWSGSGAYTGINPSGAGSGTISYTLSQSFCLVTAIPAM